MRCEILGHGLTVILGGQFNPAIFSPAWLQTRGLISEEQAMNAKLGLIHPQIAQFNVADFEVKVESNRFEISTAEEPFVQVADWIKVIFLENLSHTPVKVASINYSCHFAANSVAQRHALGRKLAPIEPWGSWGQSLDEPKLYEKGGLRSLTMSREWDPEQLQKRARVVQIEPSVRADIVNRAVGVYMLINDQFELLDEMDTVTPEKCVNWLFETFDEFITFAKSTVNELQEYMVTL